MHRLCPALLGILVLSTVPTRAEEAAGCGKFKWSIAREQVALTAPGLPTIGSGQPLPATGASVTLQPQSKVAFEAPPARKPKVDPAYAAVLTLPPVTAGTYEVTLSDEAWIDVRQDGKDIRSSGFSGQPDCPGIRKSVKFDLQPGPATVQISGASVPSIKVDVLAVE